jgi:phosphomannomutase
MKDPIKIYDARWEVHEFNDDEVKRLFEATLSYAQLLGIDTITITRDARLGCARVMEIAINTAVNAGFRVYACFDSFSTPLSYFTAMLTTLKHPNTMGLTVTASHNPQQYIGVKFTVPIVQAIGYNCGPLGGLKKVHEIYHSDFTLKDNEGGELIIITHPVEEYIKYTMDAAKVSTGSLHGLTVVLDTLNGSAGPELLKALTKAGVKVIPQRIVPNGYFPTGSPNPTSQNKMDKAIEMAKGNNADIVIGVDGDGDRIVFGDKRGLFNAGFVMIPILKTLLTAEPKSSTAKVLYDPKVNPLALKKWGELNVEPVLFRNGHSQIKGYMNKINALVGAEESGHFYHKLVLDKISVIGENSLLTILLFLDTVKKQQSILKELREMQDQVFTSGEFNYEFSSDEIRNNAMALLIEHFNDDDATITSESNDGIDLEGTVIYKGVQINSSGVTLTENWYSGYVRIATNEKGMVRSYFSSAGKEAGEKMVVTVRDILETQFNGIVKD